MAEDGVVLHGLKPSANQVAGHSFEEGHIGSLVDDSGWFYKPLQSGARGDREIEFYERFWSDERVPEEIKQFFPKFRGCVTVPVSTENSAATPIKYAVLEDLTKSFERPSIIDIKMGFRTWYPEAGEDYRKRCERKDRESTTSTLGIRISGMQVYDPQSHSKWKADRNWCRKLDNTGADYALRRFVSTNPFDDNPNALLASTVYGAARVELDKLIHWFEKQRTYHFFSSSVLIIYQGDGSESTKVSVKLVDFAHVTYDHDSIDENYLKALKSLINVLPSL